MARRQRKHFTLITRIALLSLLLGASGAEAGNVLLVTIGPTVEYEASADLSPAGQAHAEALGNLLSTITIDKIYVTPYPGTRQTAAAVAKSTGAAITEFPRSHLADLSSTLLKSQKTLLVVAWEADLRVLWRQLDLKAKLTTPLNGRVLLVRPDIPALPAQILRVPESTDSD